MSKECPERAKCWKCGRRHPNSLHKPEWERKGAPVRNTKPADAKVTPEPDRSEDEKNKMSIKATSCSKSGFNMVVSVFVPSESDANESLVYALLDSQADSSFIKSDIAKNLRTHTIQEEIIMDTLNGESVELVTQLHGLKIRGYQEKTPVPLIAYIWDNFSCNRDQIPNRASVAKLKHLEETAAMLPPMLDIPVAMLIGRNCSDAFAPVESVRGKPGQPFAHRSVLGWTVMGSDNTAHGSKHANGSRVSINTIAVTPAGYTDDDEILISQDDMQFMATMESKICKREDGSYQMPLPFRQRPVLPNNRQQAENRLGALMHKFNNDAAYKKKYQEVMDDLICNGHAESGAKQSTNPGETW